jgi:peptidoglycan hydrolase CwlO-like protein
MSRLFIRSLFLLSNNVSKRCYHCGEDTVVKKNNLVEIVTSLKQEINELKDKIHKLESKQNNLINCVVNNESKIRMLEYDISNLRTRSW